MNSQAAPTRILQVIEATLGGTRRYLEDVYAALGDGPHNGLVYSLHRADDGFLRLLEDVRAAGWTLFEVDMHRSIDPKNDLKCVRELRRIYKSFRPSIVHAHSSKAGAIARLATIGMKRRPGIVYSPHSIGVNLNWIYRPVEHILALRLDVLSAVTPSERDELRALKLLPSSRVHVIVPTIKSQVCSPGDRAEARAALDLPSGPLVVAIGRLTEQKDPLAFVEFVDKLRKRRKDVRAIWVGDGELRGAVEARIRQLGLQDTVFIAGWVEDVREHLAASDLLISTSTYESFGYVTAEALAMNRPVVASAVTGTIDVVATDVMDQLYEPQDLSAAVLLAENLLLDTAGATKIAERGRHHVLSTFSVEAMRLGLAGAYAAASRQ